METHRCLRPSIWDKFLGVKLKETKIPVRKSFTFLPRSIHKVCQVVLALKLHQKMKISTTDTFTFLAGPLYICWLFVVTSAFLYNLCGVPLRISFPYQNDENIYSWLVVDYVADVIYLIDTFLVRPRLRFVREGSWVLDVVECRKNYIQSLSSKVNVLLRMSSPQRN